MDKNIKDVFSRVAANVKPDKALVQRLAHYEHEFTHRNEEHINFFSGNLLGVDKVRFKPSDWANWFDVVLQIDDIELRQGIHALPTVNEDFKVSSDVMNISCMWVIHLIQNSTLDDKTKHLGMLSAALIFHYKVLSSKLAYDFRLGPLNRDVANAIYAQLSKKYSLKQYGSWGALLHARSEDLIKPGGIHWETIVNFDKDIADGAKGGVLYMVTDTQGRIRDVVKKLWEVLEQVRTNDSKIISTSGTVTVDGEVETGDLTRHLVSYKGYIHTVVSSEQSFIKQELIDIVGKAMHTMNPDQLELCLRYISKHYHDDVKYEMLVDEVMIHAFDFVSRETKTHAKRFDLVVTITKLRGIYMSSRSTDPELLAMRELADDIVSVPLRGKSASAQASVRTGVLLYIVLRALTRSYYS